MIVTLHYKLRTDKRVTLTAGHPGSRVNFSQGSRRRRMACLTPTGRKRATRRGTKISHLPVHWLTPIDRPPYT